MIPIQRDTSKAIGDVTLQAIEIGYFRGGRVRVGREFTASNWLAILALLAVFVFVGCGSGGVEGTHTHLWVEGKAKNVWSYERVESIEQAGNTVEIAGFLVRELKSGDKVTLMNGSRITYDGTSLIVNDHKVSTENVQLESNGSVRVNAFIKTK